MLIDSGTAVNLMLYSTFNKLGREDDELMKTNLTLNGMRGNPMEAKAMTHGAYRREQVAHYRVLCHLGAR
jgi:hypothetical protein